MATIKRKKQNLGPIQNIDPNFASVADIESPKRNPNDINLNFDFSKIQINTSKKNGFGAFRFILVLIVSTFLSGFLGRFTQTVVSDNLFSKSDIKLNNRAYDAPSVKPIF